MESKFREEVSAAVALATLGVKTQTNHPQQVPSAAFVDTTMQTPSLSLLFQQQPFVSAYYGHDHHDHQGQQHSASTIVGIRNNVSPPPELLNSSTTRKKATKGKKRNFAEKLFDVLETGFHADIVKWLPGGKAFIVMNKTRFANEILPIYFKDSQYTSFTRKLSRWKFTRVSRGPYMGAYYHKNFRADDRSLCKLMSCNNTSNHDNSTGDDKKRDKDSAAAALIVAAEATNAEKQEQEKQLLASSSAAGTQSPSSLPSACSSFVPPSPSRNAVGSILPSSAADASIPMNNVALKHALMLQQRQSNMLQTNSNILRIKEELAAIRLRKARVEKKKQLLLMQAEANRIREIQLVNDAVNMSFRHSESRIINAAARALDRSNNIHQSLFLRGNQQGSMITGANPSSMSWPSAAWLQPQDTEGVKPSSLRLHKPEIKSDATASVTIPRAA